MPVAELHLIDGYTDTEKLRLGRSVTDAIRFVIPADPDAVTVMIHDHDRANYIRGGTPRRPAVALPDPKVIVTNYLDALEQRDLVRAQSFLGYGFTMHFPGADPMTRLEDLIVWSKPRYQNVRKTFTGIEAFQGDRSAVVFVRGTLHGAWTDGSAFDGIRFVDRFEVSEGKIVLQEVWNDIAEVKAML